jgi:hypothetical protein
VPKEPTTFEDFQTSNSKSVEKIKHSNDADEAGPSHNHRFSQNIQDRNWSTSEQSDQTVTNSSVRGNLEGSPVIVKRKYNSATSNTKKDNEAFIRLNKLSHQTQLDLLKIRPKASLRDQPKDRRKDAINGFKDDISRFMKSTSKPAENMSQRSTTSWSKKTFEQSGSSAQIDNSLLESDELLLETQQILPDGDAGADDVNSDDKEILEDDSEEDLSSKRVYTNSPEF